MALRRNRDSRGFFGTRSSAAQPSASEVRRLEERYRVAQAATAQWQSVLRDMELSGESGDPRYETYFKAYIEARQQEKRFDLELFNLRRGLVG